MKVEEFLAQLEAPAHHNGYVHLRMACEMLLEDETRILNVSKLVYQKIADDLDTSVQCIDVGIRRALHATWATGNRALLEEVMGRPLPCPPSGVRFLAAARRYLAAQRQ